MGRALAPACGALCSRRGLLRRAQSRGNLGRFLQLEQVERGGAAGLEERGRCTFALRRVLTVGLRGAAARRVDGGRNGYGVGNRCGDGGRGGGDGLWDIRIVKVSGIGALLRERCSHLGEHIVGQNKGHHGGQNWGRREA